MYKSIEECIGNTPLVKANRINNSPVELYLKLEGDNPAGSIKDRAAMNMLNAAEKSNLLSKNKKIVEPTSGNTGIALAMACAIKGYELILVMPENMSIERRAAMYAYGAEIILVSTDEGMEGARDRALEIAKEQDAIFLDQFANSANPEVHYHTTGPEIWNDTEGKITHFVASMGTTGTIVGTGKYLKEKNPDIQVIGVQPEEGSSIPGIRKWSPEYIPSIFSDENIDEIIYVNEANAINTMKDLAKKEGIFSGISSGGTTYVALDVVKKINSGLVVSIICDRGDRYISTGLFNG
ncbi:MAG: cysteine synthase CysM [Pseudomonadota bacterium]|nr:cysteine synthase CysM [Pseudomonadota bacterium]MEC9190442.1 cysteine synthase CysM [Pseudomonadota bacterium]